MQTILKKAIVYSLLILSQISFTSQQKSPTRIPLTQEALLFETIPQGHRATYLANLARRIDAQEPEVNSNKKKKRTISPLELAVTHGPELTEQFLQKLRDPATYLNQNTIFGRPPLVLIAHQGDINKINKFLPLLLKYGASPTKYYYPKPLPKSDTTFERRVTPRSPFLKLLLNPKIQPEDFLLLESLLITLQKHGAKPFDRNQLILAKKHDGQWIERKFATSPVGMLILAPLLENLKETELVKIPHLRQRAEILARFVPIDATDLAPIDATDDDHAMTPLALAAKYYPTNTSVINVIKELLAMGANPNLPSGREKKTPLHFLVGRLSKSEKPKDLIKIFLNEVNDLSQHRKIDLTLKDSDEETPLDSLITSELPQSSQIEILKVLKDHLVTKDSLNSAIDDSANYVLLLRKLQEVWTKEIVDQERRRRAPQRRMRAPH